MNHLTLLSLTALLALPAHAALTGYEGFDYTPGNLKTQNGGSGWGGAWGATGTSGGDLDVVAGSLSYSTLATTGGKVEAVAANEAEYRAAAYNSGTIWLGFLAQVNGTDITTANMASLGVFNGASQLTWMAVRQNQVQLYTRNAANTAYDINSITSYTNGNTVFLVSRIQFGAGTGGSDLVDYWVNPPIGIDLTTTDASHVTTVDGRGVAFDRIRVSGSSTVGAPNYIDELRIGSTYSDVAPIPPDPFLVAASSVSIENHGIAETLEIPFSNGGATTSLNITSVTVSGPDAAFFPTATADSPVTPGASGMIDLSFDPTLPGGGAGFYQVTLTVASNDPSGSREVAVEVNVISPFAEVGPAALDYGALAAGAGVRNLEVTITNSSGEPLTIHDITATGADAAAFIPAANPGTVAPLSSAVINVAFDPGMADGFVTASLVIDTDGGNQQIFTLPLTAVVEVANPAASLVSHFDFENAANLGEDTGSFENDGTPVGDAQQSTQARVGSGSLLLDGDGDLIDLGVASGEDYTTQLLANGDGFTLCAWGFIPTGAPGARMRFFSSYMPGGVVQEGWGAGMVETNRLAGTTYGKVDYYPANGTAPARGQWHHFAYVFRNDPISRVDYYVDGALASSVSSTTTGMNPASTVGFCIGALGRPAQEQYFEGRIDDLRVYDRALVPANILAIYNAAPPESGYGTWVGSFGLDPSGNGARTLDADSDGVANALEYLFGSNPANGGERGLLQATRDGGDFVLTYRRKAAVLAEGFTDSVTFGTNLQDAANWTTAVHGVGGVTITPTPVDVDTVQVEVRIPTGGENKMFGRVKVATP